MSTAKQTNNSYKKTAKQIIGICKYDRQFKRDRNQYFFF